MAKKKTNQLGKIITLAAALLGLVAFIMFFLPAIAVKDTETTYTGFQAIFGFKETVLKNEIAHLQFSFMNLLTLILLVAGIALTVLTIMGKGCKQLPLGAIAAFLIAGIFFFLTVAFCVPGEEISSVVGAFGGNVKDGLKLAAGPIIGGICSILSALGLAYNYFVK